MPRLARQYADDYLEWNIRTGSDEQRQRVYDSPRRQKPQCENCGRETEYLFDGFVVATNARAKFILGEAIKLSAKGRSSGFGRVRRTRGRDALKATVHAFCKDEQIIRVLWEGNEQSEYFHMDFWEPVKKRDSRALTALSAPFQLGEPAKVCQRCRPPSNLEIEEILNGGGKHSSR